VARWRDSHRQECCRTSPGPPSARQRVRSENRQRRMHSACMCACCACRPCEASRQRSGVPVQVVRHTVNVCTPCPEYNEPATSRVCPLRFCHHLHADGVPPNRFPFGYVGGSTMFENARKASQVRPARGFTRPERACLAFHAARVAPRRPIVFAPPRHARHIAQESSGEAARKRAHGVRLVPSAARSRCCAAELRWRYCSRPFSSAVYDTPVRFRLELALVPRRYAAVRLLRHAEYSEKCGDGETRQHRGRESSERKVLAGGTPQHAAAPSRRRIYVGVPRCFASR